MVTIEPVLDFDLIELMRWVKNIKACMVWVGYNSRKNDLPEPSAEKFEALCQVLRDEGLNVILKTRKSKGRKSS